MQALPGQEVDDAVRFSCPMDIRSQYRVGSFFVLHVKWVNPKRLARYLYTKKGIKRITEEKAREFLARRGRPWPSKWLKQ